MRSLLKIRGQKAFREQLANAGGLYSLQRASEILGITSASVKMRIERKHLLAISIDGRIQLPVWQFSKTGAVDGFSDILSSLKNATPVSAIQFFLSYDEDLNMTVINALSSGNSDKTKIIQMLATQWQQQIAR